MVPPVHTLNSIVALLNKHHQRATYGAVGAVVRCPPQSVMKGRQHSQTDSWVVSKKTGTPTGYPLHLIHPSLEERERIIGSEEELLLWLAQHT